MSKNLMGKNYRNLTLLDAIKRYAPKEDGNDPIAYTKFVSDKTGVAETTVLKNLTPTQLNNIVEAIIVKEGFYNKNNKTYYYGQQGNPQWVDNIFQSAISDTTKIIK